MRQSVINKAFPALMRLCEFKLPVKKAREIYMMASKVKQHFEFALGEERKSIAEYNGTENSDGSVSFDTSEALEAYRERIEELNNSTIDTDWDIVVLSESDIGTQSISAADILSLEGFVVFE